MEPPVLVGGLVTTIAVTYWYAWLFNHTGGSVLLVLMAHSIEGSLQAQGWTYMAVWCVVAVGLIVCDLQAWRRPPRSAYPTDQLPPFGDEDRDSDKPER